MDNTKTAKNATKSATKSASKPVAKTATKTAKPAQQTKKAATKAVVAPNKPKQPATVPVKAATPVKEVKPAAAKPTAKPVAAPKIKTVKEVKTEKEPKKKKAHKHVSSIDLGALVQKARQQKGYTQEQVAELAGTNKSYISKVEKNLKNLRIGTLERLIKEGLGGTLEINIRF